MSHVVGAIVDIEALFYNNAGELTDPTSVTASVRYPSGATAAPTPANISVGTYVIPVAIDEAGLIYYRIESSGSETDTAMEGSVCGVASSL